MQLNRSVCVSGMLSLRGQTQSAYCQTSDASVGGQLTPITLHSGRQTKCKDEETTKLHFKFNLNALVTLAYFSLVITLLAYTLLCCQYQSISAEY